MGYLLILHLMVILVINNVVDVNFYPKNISATSATEIVDDANEMINAYIEGKTLKFIDQLER
jgi:uncharacterized protein (DUF1499 family)